MKSVVVTCGVVALASVSTAVPSAFAGTGDWRTTSLVRADVTSDGIRANDRSTSPSISGNGRRVAFQSGATNLSGSASVFVKDLGTGALTDVGFAPDGGRVSAHAIVISRNGDHVAYGTRFGLTSVYWRDLRTNVARVVSSSGFPSGSSQYPAISDDGRYVVFTQFPDRWQLMRWDSVTGATELVSRSAVTGRAASVAVLPAFASPWVSRSMSGDGQIVVGYATQDSDLVVGDTNGHGDTFVWNLAAGTVRRVLAYDGSQANGHVTPSMITADGTTVALRTTATGLAWAGSPAGLYLYDLPSSSFTLIAPIRAGEPFIGTPQVNDDKNVAVFEFFDGSGGNGHAVWQRASGEVTYYKDVHGREMFLSADGRSTALVNTRLGDQPGAGVGVWSGYVPPADRLPPIVTGTVTPLPNEAGWVGKPPTVTWSADDPEPSSGGVVAPPPITVFTEGQNQRITSAVVCDNASNCATGEVVVSVDLTAPTTATPVVSPSPVLVATPVTLSASIGDALSGVVAAEYWVGEVGEPGTGEAMAIEVDRARATFPAPAEPGLYTMFVRSRDRAGHWSDPRARRWSSTTRTRATSPAAVPSSPAGRQATRATPCRTSTAARAPRSL